MTYDELVERCQSAITDTGLLDGDEARDVARAIIPIVQEACAQVAESRKAIFASESYATNQPLSSIGERFACDTIVQAIRNMGAGS